MKTAGVWDPKQWPLYFAASNLDTLDHGKSILECLLIAVNELHDKDIAWVAQCIEAGKKVLIDSGVYWLATRHAEKHDVSMDVALSLDPTDVDGFDELYDRYVRLVRELGHRAWGYIEVDQGGKKNKRKTRAKLERLGFNPIPVYHPINDGWAYFDELAKKYDRICFGNVVNADAPTRKRLIATAWERRRAYPDLWIHALGLTPSELTVAYPINSCDSSTWIGPNRWGAHAAKTATTPFSKLDRQFVYKYGEEADSERSRQKGVRMCAYDAVMTNRVMRVIADAECQELGANLQV